MDLSLRAALEDVYNAFRNYRITDLANVGCFDFGPEPDELEGISKSLRDIPNNTLQSMEFFEKGWDSWGTKEEVKYLLPRLLEYTAEDLSRLDNPGLFSLYKYKLANCFAQENQDWTEKERVSLLHFFESLLDNHPSPSPLTGMLIECVMCMGMSPQHILGRWASTNAITSEGVKNLLMHFACPVAGTIIDFDFKTIESANGLYFEGRETIKAFLHDLLIRFYESTSSPERTQTPR